MSNGNHSKLAVLCGLPFEARIARLWIKGAKVVCSNCDPEQAKDLVRDIISQGTAKHILSFGIAGGLHPKLRRRTPIIASYILSEDGRKPVECDPVLSEKLLRRMPDAWRGAVLGMDCLEAMPDQKSRLHAEFGAVIADMESHCLIEAAEARLPVTVFRVVSESAHDYLSPAVAKMVDRNGINWKEVFPEIRRDPRGMRNNAINTARAIPVLIRGAYHLNDLSC